MTTLYIGSVVFILLGVVFSLWPYINYRLFNRIDDTTATIAREAVNVSLYRDHLTDLDASLALGSIDQAQHEQLKQELERNLIEDSACNSSNSHMNGSNDSSTTGGSEQVAIAKGSSKRHIPVFLAMVVILPIACISLYQYLGNAGAVELKAKITQQAQIQEQLANGAGGEGLNTKLSTLNREIVESLIAHAAKNEIDLDTRVLLARNAVAIGDYDTAIENFEEVIKVQPQAAQIIVELAQAIFVKSNNNAVPIVGLLAERALSIQPDNVMGLGLLGITRFQGSQYKDAIDLWERAIILYPPNSQNALALQNGIEQARLKLAEQIVSADDKGGSTPSPADTQISVTVTVAESAPFKPDDTVFVYARAWEGAKLPLAITRITVSQLPITIALDNTMAMAPQFNLSSAETVQLVARISASGQVVATAGDWEALSGPISVKLNGTKEHTLEITTPFVEEK